MAVAASTVDLTTTAAVQAYLGTTAATTADQIQTIITGISTYAMTYCSRDFRLATYNDRRDGRGTQRMFMLQRPVNSVATLTIDGTTIPPASGPPWTAGYLSDADSVFVFEPYSFTRNFQNTSITYSAGWTTPGMVAVANTGTVNLPQDLQQAVIEAVADRFTRRTNVGISAKSIAGETISYTQANLPKSASPVFAAYRNVVQGI